MYTYLQYVDPWSAIMYKFVQRIALDLSFWDDDDDKKVHGNERVCWMSFETQSRCIIIDDLSRVDFFNIDHEKVCWCTTILGGDDER